MTYMLHYAPDNASLIIRLALAHRGLEFRTALVDRSTSAQTKPSYRALNPNGLIPVLETPQGPIFETGAILLWLADTHGGLGPAPMDPERGNFLKWLFFIANTIHPSLRMLFYPEKYIGTDHAPALRKGLQNHLHSSFRTLDDIAATKPAWLGADTPTILDFYTAGVLRWPALYPSTIKQTWFVLSNYPALAKLCAHVETLPCCAHLQSAEGLGDTPFTAPHYPIPPEGSAT